MTLTGKPVFVTGGTGFLGGYVCQRLGKEGAAIRVLARRPERDRHIRHVPGLEIVPGDLNSMARLQDAMSGCDIVFHLAAATRGPLKHQQLTNIDGTRNVLEAAIMAGVKRLVHVSSIAVYGYRNLNDLDEDVPYDAAAADPYHSTKIESEKLVRAANGQGRLETSVARPGMIYGPGSNTWTRLAFKLARRKPTIWLGSGQGAAYPIYVDDVVDLLMVLATHAAAVGQAFNCTPDPPPTWREYLGAYAALTGHNTWLGVPPLIVKPLGQLAGLLSPRHSQLRDLPAILRLLDTYRTIKIDKARSLLNWEPRVSLQDGTRRCAPYLHDIGLL